MTRKTEKDEVATPAAAAAEEVRQSDVIWNKIKNLPLEIFALADQEVHMYCKREIIQDPDTVYVLLKSTAVLPALEETLMKVKLKEKELKNLMFELGQASRYTTIKLVPKPLQ
jgi:hypothetical protein